MSTIYTERFVNRLIECSIIATERRLTFHIDDMNDAVRFKGPDDGAYYRFVASNGYEIISRSRMDIQTERLWLWGGATDERSIRSGTMTFSSNEARDEALNNFMQALDEWYYANKDKGALNDSSID